LSKTRTQAYFAAVLMTKEKSFIILRAGVYVLKPFFSVTVEGAK